MNHFAIGVDIGGSHITAAIIDLTSHSIVANSIIRHSINAKAGETEIINQWSDAMIHCKSFMPGSFKKMGIAMPGPFDYEKGICLIKDLDKYEALYNLNVKELLAEKLGIDVADIFMMNDASCFLKGEIFSGTAKDSNNVIGITLGTGLGSAVCKNGIIYDGDLYCAKFKDQTAEDYLSTRWFLRRYQQLSGKNVNNVKEISEQVANDKNAAMVFKEFGKNLGEVLANYIRKHDAETVIIGGNIMKAWELFIDETKAELSEQGIIVSLIKAKLGETALLLGAGSLCLKV